LQFSPAGCPTDGGGDGEKEVTISFAYMDMDGKTPTGITAPSPVKIKEGGSLGSKLTAPTTEGDYTFVGWWTKDGAPVTASTTFKADDTVYGIWYLTDDPPDPADIPDPTKPVDPFEPGGPGTGEGDAVVEKLFLENGAYAVYKFTIPAGSKWEDYEKITVEYNVDAENLAIGPRNNRLMGPYYPADFEIAEGEAKSGKGEAQIDMNGARALNMNLNWTNNRHIMDNKTTGWAGLGITNADTWTTVTYDISGTSGHGDFKDETNDLYVGVPAADYTGDIYFGLGVNAGYDGGRGKAATGITQLVRNVTLVGYQGTDDIVSTGSGFEEPTFIANIDPVLYSWRGPENVPVVIPPTPCECSGLGDDFCGCFNCTIDPVTLSCQNNCCIGLPPAIEATASYTVTLDAEALVGTGGEVTENGIKNETAWAAENGGPIFIALNFPKQGNDQLDIRSYVKYTVKAKFYDASGAEMVHSGSGTTEDPFVDKPNGYFRFRTGDADSETFGANIGGGQWNINYDTVDKEIAANILEGGPAVRWIAVQNGGTNADNKTLMPAFVEIIEVTFYHAGYEPPVVLPYLDADPPYEGGLELDEPVSLGGQDYQVGWVTDGVDGIDSVLTFDALQEAKWLVIGSKGSGPNNDGFGGFDFVLQGSGNNWAWGQTAIMPGWTSCEKDAEATYWFCIKLSTLPQWSAILTGENAKICTGYTAGLGIQSAYIYSDDIEKPEGAIDIANSGTTYGFIITP
jgi:hypothetical protein